MIVISNDKSIVPGTEMDAVQVRYLVTYARVNTLKAKAFERHDKSSVDISPTWHYPDWLAHAIASGVVVRIGDTFQVHSRGKTEIAAGDDWLIRFRGRVRRATNQAYMHSFTLKGTEVTA